MAYVRPVVVKVSEVEVGDIIDPTSVNGTFVVVAIEKKEGKRPRWILTYDDGRKVTCYRNDMFRVAGNVRNRKGE